MTNFTSSRSVRCRKFSQSVFPDSPEEGHFTSMIFTARGSSPERGRVPFVSTSTSCPRSSSIATRAGAFSWSNGSPPVTHVRVSPKAVTRETTSSSGISSPASYAYVVSQYRHRRLHPVSRTKANGYPECEVSPWTLAKISVIFSIKTLYHGVAQAPAGAPNGTLRDVLFLQSPDTLSDSPHPPAGRCRARGKDARTLAGNHGRYPGKPTATPADRLVLPRERRHPLSPQVHRGDRLGIPRRPRVGSRQRGGHLHVDGQPPVDTEGDGSGGREPPVRARKGGDAGHVLPGRGHRPYRGWGGLGGGAPPARGKSPRGDRARRGHSRDDLLRGRFVVHLRPDPEGRGDLGLLGPCRRRSPLPDGRLLRARDPLLSRALQGHGMEVAGPRGCAGGGRLHPRRRRATAERGGGGPNGPPAPGGDRGAGHGDHRGAPADGGGLARSADAPLRVGDAGRFPRGGMPRAFAGAGTPGGGPPRTGDPGDAGERPRGDPHRSVRNRVPGSPRVRADPGDDLRSAQPREGREELGFLTTLKEEGK